MGNKFQRLKKGNPCHSTPLNYVSLAGCPHSVCSKCIHSCWDTAMCELSYKSELHTHAYAHTYTKLVEQEETPGMPINKKKQWVFIRRGTLTGFPWTSVWNWALHKRHIRALETHKCNPIKVRNYLTMTLCLERWRICNLVNVCDCSDIVNLLCLWCITIPAWADGAILYVHVPQHSLRFPFVWHNSLCP